MITIPDIIEAAAKRYEIPVDDILSKRRLKLRTEARHVAMYLARQLTPYSTKEIGMAFGGRDHSTVVQATQGIENRVKLHRNVQQAVHDVIVIVNKREHQKNPIP